MSRYQILIPLAWLISFFALLLIYTKIFGPIPFSVNSVTTQKSTTFDVSGEGKVTVQPDVATLNAGISATASTVKAAQDQINTVINKVSSAVKGLGVDSSDIKTTNYSINPNYDYRENSQRITGYNASTNLSIKVRNIDKVNEVIDTLIANGANQVSGVSFDVDDKTKAENEARQKAVAEAKQKAQAAAQVAGFRLGKIINYTENFGGFPRPIVQPMRVLDEKAVSATTQIEPGSSEVYITVTLSYELQ
ncbi:SIMPL domain-containing protein [Candidatus Daviesbacteria bacterium]|nr:SIMPL domain-containing protein [Candidatus Daviesbacteria bacterium]